MPGGYLYAWDETNEVWVKVSATADGEIEIISE